MVTGDQVAIVAATGCGDDRPVYTLCDMTARGVYPPKDEDADFPLLVFGLEGGPLPFPPRKSPGRRLPRPSPLFCFGT